MADLDINTVLGAYAYENAVLKQRLQAKEVENRALRDRLESSANNENDTAEARG